MTGESHIEAALAAAGGSGSGESHIKSCLGAGAGGGALAGESHIMACLAAPLFTGGGNPIVWWDFTDASTLWKDAARTMPVTSDGDEIKGVTDKGRGGLHLEPQFTNGPRYTVAGINSLSAADFDGFNTESLISTLAYRIIDPNYSFMIVAEWDGGAAPGGFRRAFIWSSQVFAVGAATTPLVRILTLDDEVSQDANSNGVFAGWGAVTGFDGEASINKTAGKEVVNDFPPNLSTVKPTVGGGTGTGVEWHGMISEIVVWDDSNVIATQAQIEAYASGRYAVTWL